MNESTPPPTPLDELLIIARKASDGTAWAVGEGQNNRGKFEWYIYCSSKKQANRLPYTYRGRKVKIFHCPKPRIVD